MLFKFYGPHPGGILGGCSKPLPNEVKVVIDEIAETTMSLDGAIAKIAAVTKGSVEFNWLGKDRKRGIIVLMGEKSVPPSAMVYLNKRKAGIFERKEGNSVLCWRLLFFAKKEIMETEKCQS